MTKMTGKQRASAAAAKVVDIVEAREFSESGIIDEPDGLGMFGADVLNTPFAQYKENLARLLLDAGTGEPRRRLMRHLARTDLWFLLVHICGRRDIDREWLWARCCEVQDDPDGYLDLWARDHYKSTIITFGKTIQDVLASHGEDALTDREICVGIFSHTRPIAKGFLRQIKQEFEGNVLMKGLFPDILWADAQAANAKWSEDDGITVIRKSNPKEATIEAWGVVDGQPTSKHFPLLVYDDLVTLASVNTPEMIAKTTDALALSFNLSTDGGAMRFIGTRYAHGDTYKTVIDRQIAKPRVYAATIDATEDGDPVLLSPETLAKKRRMMGPYIFSAQMLQNPTADTTQGFREEWMRYYSQCDGTGMTLYMLVDAASSRKKGSDYTAIWVIGLGGDGNYYVLDIVRDRLNLTQRAAKVIELHKKWKRIHQVRYERYGMMGDIEHITSEQEKQNYRFTITEVAGQTSKADRIKRLVPLFENGKVYFPRRMMRTGSDGRAADLVEDFIHQEFLPFPVPIHDDMLDSLARICEPTLTLTWPKSDAGIGAGLNFGSQFTGQGAGAGSANLDAAFQYEW